MRFFGFLCIRNGNNNIVRVSSIIVLILVICCWVLFSLLSIVINHVQQQQHTGKPIGHSFHMTQQQQQQQQQHHVHHLKENNSTLYDVNNAMKNVFIQNHTMLFIHIPKSAGTSFTALLRQIQCHIDPKAHSDCCHHPGSCYYKDHRICRSIIGCVSHYPRCSLINKVHYSITLLREPVSRFVSGWFYPGHNPNSDAFHVRSSSLLAPSSSSVYQAHVLRGSNRTSITAPTPVSFQQYIEMMEYQNIQTRMLGADSFPYRSVTITEQVFQNAKKVLNSISFVGLQEEFDLSCLLLLRMMNLSSSSQPSSGMKIDVSSLPRERSLDNNDSNNKVMMKRKFLLSNQNLVKRIEEHNRFDVMLYRIAIKKFCSQLCKYPDLLTHLTTITC